MTYLSGLILLMMIMTEYLINCEPTFYYKPLVWPKRPVVKPRKTYRLIARGKLSYFYISCCIL